MAILLKAIRLPRLDPALLTRVRKIYLEFDPKHGLPIAPGAMHEKLPAVRLVRPPPTLRSRRLNVLELAVDPAKLDSKVGLAPVDIESCSGELVLARSIVELDDGITHEVLPTKAAAGAAPGQPEPLDALQPGSPNIIDVFDNAQLYYDELWSRLPAPVSLATPSAAAAPKGPQAAMLLFADLDRRTDPQLSSILARTAPLETRISANMLRGMQACLLEQLELRRAVTDPAHHTGDPRGTAERYATFGLGRHVTYVGGLLLDLLDAYLPGAGGRFDPAKARTAFEDFATGRLRLTLPSGSVCCQPSGAAFFLFGELALFAHGCGHPRAAEWLELARTMVYCQELFGAIYAPSEGAPPYEYRTYWGANYVSDRVEEFGNPKMLHVLRGEYAPFDPDALRWRAAANARMWLRVVE